MNKQVSEGLLSIIWGLLLHLLNFTFSWNVAGLGFRLDLLDDSLGVVLILAGLSKLNPLLDDDLYRRSLLVVRGVAVLELVRSLDAHLIYWRPPAIVQLITIVAVLVPLGVLLFSIAMRRLCDAIEGLKVVSSSWTVTSWVVGSSSVLWTLRLLFSRSFLQLNATAQVMGLILVSLALLPVLHLFLSLWRTRRTLLLLGENNDALAAT